MHMDYNYYKSRILLAYRIGPEAFEDNICDITDWEARSEVTKEDAERLRNLNASLQRLFSEGDAACSEKR